MFSMPLFVGMLVMKELGMNLTILGKRIQSIREKKGLTQEQMEERTGVNTKYISAVERGQKNVTIKTLEKLAAGLDVELYQLFLITEEIRSEEHTSELQSQF